MITRNSYTKEFKLKVALEAVKEEITIAEIATKHEIHPNQVTAWKKEFLDNASEIFERKGKKKNKKDSKVSSPEELYKQIGQLRVENEFLKKKYKQLLGKEPPL